MFQPKLPASVDEIHFDDPLFWSLPVEQREGAFLLLRRERPMAFHQEFEPPPNERCREVLMLWALEGLSREDIAARLGISEHTVRAQLAKGVKRCVKFMRERGILDEIR